MQEKYEIFNKIFGSYFSYAIYSTSWSLTTEWTKNTMTIPQHFVQFVLDMVQLHGEIAPAFAELLALDFFSQWTNLNFQKDLIVFFVMTVKEIVFYYVNHHKLVYIIAYMQNMYRYFYLLFLWHFHGFSWSESLQCVPRSVTWANLMSFKRI